jgi:hypothetical protein
MGDAKAHQIFANSSLRHALIGALTVTRGDITNADRVLLRKERTIGSVSGRLRRTQRRFNDVAVKSLID